MSDIENVPDGVDLARGESDLAAATEQFRAVTHSNRLVEVADRVLEAALAAPRRASLVRAAPPQDFLRISTLVITTVLRERIDSELVGAAVSRVLLDVERDETLGAVTVELYVQYGTVVADVADTSRELAHDALVDLLGSATGLPVTVSHVHVADVTLGDPHLVDPSDD